jgi:hypothetical protein
MSWNNKEEMIISNINNKMKMRKWKKTNLKNFIATRRARYWQRTSTRKAEGFKTMGICNKIKSENLQNCEKKTPKREINVAAFSAALWNRHKKTCAFIGFT